MQLTHKPLLSFSLSVRVRYELSEVEFKFGHARWAKILIYCNILLLNISRPVSN